MAPYAARSFESPQQISSYLLRSSTTLFLAEHGEVAPRVQGHAAQDKRFQGVLMKSASHEGIVRMLCDQSVGGDALLGKWRKRRA